MISPATFLAAALVVLSAPVAFAQGAAGAGQVSPTTTTTNPNAPAADRNPKNPGATGAAKVPGNQSTVAGNGKASVEQRTGEGTNK